VKFTARLSIDILQKRGKGMNKSELITMAAQNAGMARKDAERVINAAIDAMTAALVNGDKVQLSGFGSFEVKDREARIGRNPHTKETVEIPATKVPVFKASKALRDNVAK
jgi:DNA-binding protein HU-beta